MPTAAAAAGLHPATRPNHQLQAGLDRSNSKAKKIKKNPRGHALRSKRAAPGHLIFCDAAITWWLHHMVSVNRFCVNSVSLFSLCE